jgi:hypothetical protein
VPFISLNEIFSKTASYGILDHEKNELITEELKITPITRHLQQYRRNLLQHINQMERSILQDDQKVSVQLMITIQKVTNSIQSVPRQSPDIY